MTLVAETDKLGRIREEYARDIAEMPPARSIDDIPAFYECITPEWLTAILRRRFPEIQVAAYTLDEPDSGTTNRRRIFLHYHEYRAEWPHSLFCKAAQDLANRITMSSGSAQGEVDFYNILRPMIKFDAPEALFAAVDPLSYRAIIVMEDMREKVEFCTYRTPMSRARVESQLDVLARMHGRFYGATRVPHLDGLDTWQERFGRIERYHGLAGACYNGLLAAGHAVPSALANRIDEVWPRTLDSVTRMDDLPVTLTHGDDHLGNWYVRSDDQMGLTDFQNVSRGHWSRDVAYAIATALTIEDRRAWERDLLTFYLERLRAYGGGDESFEDSWINYRQQMLTVLAWWTVTLTPSKTMVQEMQSRETTLCFIERIAHAVHDLRSLDAFESTDRA